VHWSLTKYCVAAAASFCVAAASTTPSNSDQALAATARTKARVGNVGTSMPAAAISSSDALPRVLYRGRRYEIEVHVGVAGGQPQTEVTIVLAGADRSVCLAKPVPSGTITTLRCAFVPILIGPFGVRVSVLVASEHASPVTATFVHPVVATASSK
jgi:hypothetical protein